MICDVCLNLLEKYLVFHRRGGFYTRYVKNRTKRYENINIRRQGGGGVVMKAVGKVFLIWGGFFFKGKGFRFKKLIHRQKEVKNNAGGGS